MIDDYSGLDAVGLAAAIRQGSADPVAVLEAAIDRIKGLDQLGALVHRSYERARSEVAGGVVDGPFAGVPFLLKDLRAYDAGEPSTSGSRFWAEHVPEHDSEIVRRFKRAGLVILGRTNTPELGLNLATEPVLHGPTLNPWDPSRIPGGSSGGAAAAVAARMVPAAYAIDGGGSIRVPASCCGLFGLKPTRGRNPFGPDLGEGWAGMSAEHVVTRSVRDSAAMLDVTAGSDVGAPCSAAPQARPFAEEVVADPGVLRVAVWPYRPDGSPLHPACAAAVGDAASLLEGLGHRVEEAKPRHEFAGDVYGKVVNANVAAAVAARARVLGREPRTDELEPTVVSRVAAGEAMTGSEYVTAVQTLQKVGRQVAEFFETYDVYVTPTVATPPVPVGTFDMSDPDVDRFRDRLAEFSPFTALFNITGQPAMSVPLWWTDDGLPIGTHVAGRYGDEATLFRLAGQLELARPWSGRRPPVS